MILSWSMEYQKLHQKIHHWIDQHLMYYHVLVNISLIKFSTKIKKRKYRDAESINTNSKCWYNNETPSTGQGLEGPPTQPTKENLFESVPIARSPVKEDNPLKAVLKSQPSKDIPVNPLRRVVSESNTGKRPVTFTEPIEKPPTKITKSKRLV